ncbi:MAG: hypothetical protein QW802_00080 [Candidatus Altiarchaeota archaeon]
MPIFVWIWNNIWAIILIFFFFDFLNLILIYSLAKFKKISSLLYVFSPSLFRGLLFLEVEIFTIAFILASIYFFYRKRYFLSTIMLALSFNLQIFPIVLFPVLLLNMNLMRENENKFFPKVDYKKIFRYLIIFILTSVICHLFFFPEWKIFYEYRTFEYTLSQKGTGIWVLLQLSPSKFYLPILIISLVIFYFFTYIKNLNIESGYFLGSLLFISLFPKFSVDHFIIISTLFLIWTQWSKADVFFWIFFTVGIFLEFLSLSTIGIVDKFTGTLISLSILIGFYFVVIKNL